MSQELLDKLYENIKEALPKFEFKNQSQLDDNIKNEAIGSRIAHSFRFRLSQVTQSIKHLSLKKGTAEARERSELRYNSALRTMIRDSDAMSRISKNSDIYIDSDGNASLIITDWSSLTEQDKDSIELYAIINGLDVRRTK